MLLSASDASLFEEAVWLVGTYMVINILTILFAIASKWVILGRMKPGRYPLWGVYYYRWWLVQRITALTHPKWFQGSPVMRLFMIAMGAKVGMDAIIGDHEAGALDLLEIGERASIGGKVNFANARVEGADFIVGRIAIGSGSYIGTSCVIEEDVTIGEGAELGDLTAIAAGTAIGAYENWDGSPGRRVGLVDRTAIEAFPTASLGRKTLLGFGYVAMLLVIPPLGLLPIFPAFWVFDQLDDWLSIPDVDRFAYLASLPLLAWPTSFVMVLISVAFIVAMRWLVLPRVKAGRYSVFSFFYSAQMDRRTGDRDHVGGPDIAVRNRLHAGLVQADGRQDRQGCRDLDQSVGPLRSRRDRRKVLHRRRSRARRRGDPGWLDAALPGPNRRPGVRGQ